MDDAAEFFDTYYAPGNAVLTVVGDLDVEDALALVEKHFGDVPARPRPVRPVLRRAAADQRAPAQPCPTRTRRCRRWRIGYRLPDPTSDLDGYLAHALLASTLTDGEAARLQQRLVHGDAIVTDVSAGCGLLGAPLDARDPDTFTVTAVHPVRCGSRPGADRRRRGARPAGRRRSGGRRAVPRSPPAGLPALYHEQDRVMNRMLALGSRELLFGRAELAAELPVTAGRRDSGAGRRGRRQRCAAPAAPC